MKLSKPQAAVLVSANKKSSISFLDAMRLGGNGRTLSALCASCMLEKFTYPDGSNVWLITDAGRAAVAKATEVA